MGKTTTKEIKRERRFEPAQIKAKITKETTGTDFISRTAGARSSLRGLKKIGGSSEDCRQEKGSQKAQADPQAGGEKNTPEFCEKQLGDKRFSCLQRTGQNNGISNEQGRRLPESQPEENGCNSDGGKALSAFPVPA